MIKTLFAELITDERRRLMHFSLSAVVFFIGYWMIYWSEENLPASLKQELIALGLLVITATAFCWAITMQILYIISKIKNN